MCFSFSLHHFIWAIEVNQDRNAKSKTTHSDNTENHLKLTSYSYVSGWRSHRGKIKESTSVSELIQKAFDN